MDGDSGRPSRSGTLRSWHTAAVRMGREVLARSGGCTEAVEAAVARAPRPVALRAGRLLAAVLAARR